MVVLIASWVGWIAWPATVVDVTVGEVAVVLGAMGPVVVTGTVSVGMVVRVAGRLAGGGLGGVAE
ncbi:MAG: hypothetical protein HQK59_10920 [Deltaproteobacteria bacterium]|nr:hypothetical protein [Deltaproteobacteria bacterium]